MAGDDNFILDPGESVSFCVDAFFVDDESNWWWGGMNGLTNNMAMDDDVQMDLLFALEQVTP